MMSFSRSAVLSLVVTLTLGIPSLCTAKEVYKSLKNGVIATADYVKGRPDKPALFILHGFLQTRHNATVHNLAEELSAEGYSILSPTLSLGISKRKRSLACEAPHPHTFEQDVSEVSEWINWLQQQGHKQIILVGHSTGNIALLAYAQRYKNPLVTKLIAVSLIEYRREFGANSNNNQIVDANRDAKDGDHKLKSYKLSYCNNYLAPAEAFITYANWDMDLIIKTIHKLDKPLYVIAGSADERMHDGWLKRLSSTDSIIRQIEGANHFFNSIYQFDLHDQVNISIKE